ncbi:hypothetical protein RFI_19227, partial [Reticulomyxa filosa]
KRSNTYRASSAHTAYDNNIETSTNNNNASIPNYTNAKESSVQSNNNNSSMKISQSANQLQFKDQFANEKRNSCTDISVTSDMDELDLLLESTRLHSSEMFAYKDVHKAGETVVTNKQVSSQSAKSSSRASRAITGQQLIGISGQIGPIKVPPQNIDEDLPNKDPNTTVCLSAPVTRTPTSKLVQKRNQSGKTSISFAVDSNRSKFGGKHAFFF